MTFTAEQQFRDKRDGFEPSGPLGAGRHGANTPAVASVFVQAICDPARRSGGVVPQFCQLNPNHVPSSHVRVAIPAFPHSMISISARPAPTDLATAGLETEDSWALRDTWHLCSLLFASRSADGDDLRSSIERNSGAMSATYRCGPQTVAAHVCDAAFKPAMPSAREITSRFPPCMRRLSRHRIRSVFRYRKAGLRRRGPGRARRDPGVLGVRRHTASGVAAAKLPFAITHAPGLMLVTDLKNKQLPCFNGSLCRSLRLYRNFQSLHP